MTTFSLSNIVITGKRFLIYILFTISALLLLLAANAQNTGISGYVKDAVNKRILPGVNVVINNKSGTATNNNGFFQLELEPGEHQLVFSIIGYEPVHKKIYVIQGENKVIDVLMPPSSTKIDEIVVTASRFEQRQSDVSVSMSLMKPEFIQSINSKEIDNTLNYLPGVEIIDGQASIRGGSGYSYGAGSRVLVLVDDLPMLSAAEGDVKWNFIPVENIVQVEVLKGASSALYGSSALNGIINIRTAYPGIKPETKFTIYSGLYNKPKREEMVWWWKTNPLFSGFSFSHLQKTGNLDVVVGANGLTEPGYRESNYDERFRANFKIRHCPKSVEGLSYGLNSNAQWQSLSDFFIWENADSGAFLQQTEMITPVHGWRLNVDPWISYFDKNQNRHAIKMRFYGIKNKFDDNPDKNNASDLYYGEYMFHRIFNNNLNLTAGCSGLYGKSRAELYGDHYNSTIAMFTQADYKFFNQLTANFGLRWEKYSLDQTDKESGFVTRAGLNYHLAKATFLRASFGQGYRFPSIAEKYTATNLGSLNIFPNPDLESETGWSLEFSVRQGLTIRDWKMFLDAAIFRTEYNNMIEFIFGVYKPDSVIIPTLKHVGFKSLNIGKARITGAEIGVTGNGKIGKFPINMFVGYTYTDPVDLSSETLTNNILKYRYRHSFKANISADIQKFTVGTSVIYRSFIERIDAIFEEEILGQEIFPGLKDYRLKNNEGNWVFDLSLAYDVTNTANLSLIGRNLFNKEYMGRPGDIQAPRNIILQAVIHF